MKIFTLFDRKSREYGQLVLAVNDAVMVRSLQEQLPERATQRQYPEDFDLVSLGEYEPESGIIDATSPALVMNLTAALEAKTGA